MTKRRAYFLDASYTIKQEKTYVTLLVKGKKITKLYYRYDPYFYVDAPLDKKQDIDKLVAARKNGEMVSPLKVEETTVSIGSEKKKLLKVYCKTPQDVPAIKTAMPFKCYEYNIPFAKRFMFDFDLIPLQVIVYERKGKIISKIIESKPGEPELSTLAFDIETYNPMGAPRERKDPSIMISYCGKEKGVITYKKSKKKFVESVSDEKEMLEKFSEIIAEQDPDILFGYNSANFDIPYLLTRMDATKADFCIWKGSSKPRKIRRGMTSGMKVPGRIHVDLYPMMRFFGFIGLIKAQRFTLDSIATEVLGKKKVEINKKEMWKVWDSGEIDELAGYSLVDSELTMELGNRFLPLAMELSRLTKIPLFDITLSTSGQMVENILMAEASKQKVLVPSRPGGDKISERLSAPIQGAFVKLPEPGVYDNIAVLDFRGLYPSIIISYNIDPYTLTEKGKACYESPTGARFLKKPEGLVPYVLKELVNRRAKIKKQMKKLDPDSDEYIRTNARSHALKIVSNSIAGDEPLLLRDPTKQIRIITASEFIDHRLNNEYIGKTQLGNVNGWEAAAVVKNRITFKKINKIMRHNSRHLFEIVLKSGRTVKTTADHSIFTLDKSGLVKPVKAIEIKKGDAIVVPKTMNMLKSKKRITRINLLKALASVPDKETEDIVLNIRLGQLTKKLPIRKKILADLDDCEYNYPTKIGENIGTRYRSVSVNLKSMTNEGLVEITGVNSSHYKICEKGREYQKFIRNILTNANYVNSSRLHSIPLNAVKSYLKETPDCWLEEFRVGPKNGTKIKCIVDINQKIARLLGYYVSEGYSRKWLNKKNGYSYRSGIVNYNQEILDDIKDCFKILNVKIKRTSKFVESNTKMAYLIFKYVFSAGESAYKKRVPGLILNGDKTLQSNFIHTYHLGDGSYQKKQKMYKFTSVSRKLIYELAFLLLRLDIRDITFSRDSRYYRLYVWGEIPSVGLNRNKKLNRHFVYSIPGSYLESEIRKLKNIRYYSSIKGRLSKKRFKQFYLEYRTKFGRSEKIERFFDLFDCDLAFDSVRKIRKTKNKQNVYDLSVEDAENFIGGFGWICLHNSFYGYLAYARSRWYSRPCGESVTAWGRKHINETIEIAEKQGFQVLYADTDSVFLVYTEREKVMEFMDKVNKSLPGDMELELEGFFTRGVFVSKKSEEKGAKKKYALLGEDGRIKIRGFELVRRDWSPIAKDTQKRVLEAILKEGSKEKAVNIVRENINRLKQGKVEMQELAIVTQLKKDPKKYEVASPELSAAKKLLARGMPIEQGSVISYVITTKGKSISEKAESVEFAKDYDAEYYINHQVLPAVMKILKELGYDEYGLKMGGKQKSLDSFFG